MRRRVEDAPTPQLAIEQVFSPHFPYSISPNPAWMTPPRTRDTRPASIETRSRTRCNVPRAPRQSGRHPLGRRSQRECRVYSTRRRRAPGPPDLGGPTKRRSRIGDLRSIEYRLVAGASRIELGGFLLGSMRVERDYQYAEATLAAIDAGTLSRRRGVGAGGGCGPAPARGARAASGAPCRGCRGESALATRADHDLDLFRYCLHRKGGAAFARCAEPAHSGAPGGPPAGESRGTRGKGFDPDPPRLPASISPFGLPPMLRH